MQKIDLWLTDLTVGGLFVCVFGLSCFPGSAGDPGLGLLSLLRQCLLTYPRTSGLLFIT